MGFHRLRLLSPAHAVAASFLIGLVIVGFPSRPDDPGAARKPATKGEGKGGHAPSDWFFAQRAYPHTDLNPADLARARAQAAVLRADAAGPGGRGAAFWDPVGPTNIGGRIADLAVHPMDAFTLYVGAAEGGVIKTTDGGSTWTPTFDDVETLSIGDLAIDPTHPDIIYAGTGEPNGGGGSLTYGGLGIYKTTNGGVTWTNMGLTDTRYIGRVVIDSGNPNIVFVAAMGALFSTNPERGVFRSTDAGASWEHVLSVNDSTGAIDLVIDRQNPDRIYAATWERIRRPHTRDYGGPGSGIYRSTDGGDTWSLLGGGLPAPSPNIGRIGIAISLANPMVLYAIYADAVGNFAGVYRTQNGGDLWTRTNDAALSGAYATYGWWFGNIRVTPTDPNRVFVLGLDAYRSTNGGASWSQVGGNMHVDHHALEYAPTDTGQFLYEGNDGGLYRSLDGGTTWTEIQGLPITQFYTVEVDHLEPHRRYGGTQDNGTNRTLTGSPNDWAQILGGDGFHVHVDPTNNSFVYAEYQYGNFFRSTNGGSSFSPATNGISAGDRMNWSTPVVLDPSNPATLYYGSQRVYRSTNRAVSWSAISNDLTDGAGGSNGVIFGTLTALAVAPSDPQVIYAGTDDANVWVTQNGGGLWTRVDAQIPERWVTRVAVHPSSAGTAYVTLSGFRDDDPLSHVYRTTNFGSTWSPVSNNLPEAPVNDIVIDGDDPATLFVATDVGVYFSSSSGSMWSALGAGLPNGVVNDLELHGPTRTLTAATYGRSLFTYDLGAVLGVEVADAAAHTPRLSPPAPNPTAAATQLRYDLPRRMWVTLRIYDVAGRLVRTLKDGDQPLGTHTASWDGRSTRGQLVGAGVYVARLEADGVVRSHKVIINR
jgi:photosystem II stability/assembly factor-like uncharacterized protein